MGGGFSCVLPSGCGEGYQAVAFDRAGASQVIGIEINDRLLDLARKRAAGLGLAKTVRLRADIVGPE